MAHFYGRMTGQAALTVTRMGSKASGVEAEVHGSDIGGEVNMHHYDLTDTLRIKVSSGRGMNYLSLMSCVRDGERIVCTINKHLPEHIIIK